MRTPAHHVPPNDIPTPRAGETIPDMPTGAERYGALIRRMRELRGMSRERLARELNTRPQTVMGWEKGSTEQFNLDKIREVGDLLGFNRDDYLSIFGIDAASRTTPRAGFEADPDLTEEDKQLLRQMQSKLRGGGKRKDGT